jgi:lipopolysaccharide transport system ATP-binding protein
MFDPEILLIDEILAVGDMSFQKKCLTKMMEFKKGGVTIIFVSHSIDQIKMICDKTIWIQDHHIKMEGNTLDIVTKYEAEQMTPPATKVHVS